MARRSTLLAVVLIAVVVAGCTQGATLRPASTSSEASKVNAMMQSPPGSNVKPTGVVKEFTLYLHPMVHEIYPGAKMGMWGFSFSDDPATATVPGPTIRVTEGDLVRVTLRSLVPGFNHTLHFHGQNAPADMDGVPYLSQPDAVAPDGAFTYEFIAKPAGTYWYHCHVDSQHHIDMGMYGAFIVDPQDPSEDPHYDKEFLMILDEMDRYHVESGSTPTTSTPQGGDLYSWQDYTERTANDALTRNSQVVQAEQQANLSVRPNRDWYPVTYPAYTATYNTYLIDGFAFPYTPMLVVKQGDVDRIRFINAGNSLFSMHLHGHHMLVTHKDGVLLESPYWVDTLPIAPGERYDVYVKMDNPGMWDFHDHVGGHTQNDDIFPGGAMTMMCYEGTTGCADSGEHHHHGGEPSGDLLHWSGHELP